MNKRTLTMVLLGAVAVAGGNILFQMYQKSQATVA